VLIGGVALLSSSLALTGELLRKTLPRTWVNRGTSEGPKIPPCIYSTLLTACAIWPLPLLAAG
jgi:hypothetical protein